MESLDMLANNIANGETSGYKTDREFYNLYVSSEAASADGGDASTLPVIEGNYVDYSQGSLRSTSNPLDFALDGKGFFTVDSPTGPVYTRNGSFHMSTAGNLVTPEGYAVTDPKGKPLKLDPLLPVEVDKDGTITQSGQVTGQFAVVGFDNPRLLAKQGNTYFRNTDPKTLPTAAAASVQQGRVESSNVGSAESAVRLVNVMRQFEMLQRAANIGSSMNKKATDEVARIGT